MIIAIKRKALIYISFSIILIVGAILCGVSSGNINNEDVIKTNSHSIADKIVVLDARASESQTGRCCK